MMIKYVCDRCNRESVLRLQGAGLPKGWVSLSYTAGHATVGYLSYSHILCVGCREQLQIPENYGEQDEDISTRLIAIIEEIVQGAKKED